MNPRKEFLLALFRRLEEKQVRYAVIRNYDDIFESTTSDVDLAVESKQLFELVQCMREAAVATAHAEVLKARYVNHSYVYFHAQGGFLRIDVETETRWRIFPILSAKAIVALRRKHGEFYIPHPRHESVVLFTASIWRGSVSDRYKKQLSRLYGQVNDPDQLKRSFHAIFGQASEMLVDYQSRATDDPCPGLNLKTVRRGVILEAIRTGPNRRALAHNLAVDIRRLFDRVFHPLGISLLFTSSAKPAWNIRTLLERIEFLYPIEKSTLHYFDRFPQGPHSVRLTWRLRMERLRTLFKGGLFIRFYHVQNDKEIDQVIGTHTRYIFPSRAFVCVENSRQEIVLAHVGTGFMAQFDSSLEESLQEQRMLKLIAGVLNRNRNAVLVKNPVSKQGKDRGAFVVLLGLDGSGKTTVARELCCAAEQTCQFQAVRYFHWRPSLRRKNRFPLSNATNTPRKPLVQPNIFRSMVSALRLFKNLFLIKLAWWFKVESLLHRKTLVIMDRYFYNYYLDPASVRYYGPSWLVDKLRPAFPKPDLIVVLSAPPATLLARKQELSEKEIFQQNARLQQIALDSLNSIVVDATRPAHEIAREILSRLKSVQGQDQQNRPVTAPLTS